MASHHWADNEKDLERTAVGAGDDQSDRSILREESRWGRTMAAGAGKGPGVIKKTNEVTITYEGREGSERSEERASTVYGRAEGVGVRSAV